MTETIHCSSMQPLLGILQTQYWELYLACPSDPDHTHTNGPNQINVFMYTWSHAKNQFNILTHFWDIADLLF